jgi:putative endopeptidase
MGDLLRGQPRAALPLRRQQDEKDSSKQIAEIGQAASRCPIATTTSEDTSASRPSASSIVDHVTKMFTLAGDTPEKAAKEAAA